VASHAHAVRNTAAGLGYVLYAILCEKDDPTRVLYSLGGRLIAPEGGERVGDVSNLLFSNGVIVEKDDHVLVYYVSSDTRLHVAESTVERLLDYVKNAPPDARSSGACVSQRIVLIRKKRRLP
jgi:4-O-beta-D-mannosyl-D-glucose phosphorylase